MPVEPLYLVCDKCGKPTPSGMAADPENVADTRSTFRDNETNCSHCGHFIPWSKAELWPESVIRQQFPGFSTRKPEPWTLEPMSHNLQSVNLIVCERVLTEIDGVNSAIRIVDTFFVPPAPPEIAPEKRGVKMQVLIIGKATVPDDRDHTVQIQLIRPNGETKFINDEPATIKYTSKIADIPGGFNAVIAIGIAPSQMGDHYFVLLMDGQEVARTRFTLALPPSQNPPGKAN